jgi:hypothetical protein
VAVKVVVVIEMIMFLYVICWGVIFVIFFDNNKIGWLVGWLVRRENVTSSFYLSCKRE